MNFTDLQLKVIEGVNFLREECKFDLVYLADVAWCAAPTVTDDVIEEAVASCSLLEIGEYGLVMQCPSSWQMQFEYGVYSGYEV